MLHGAEDLILVRLTRWGKWKRPYPTCRPHVWCQRDGRSTTGHNIRPPLDIQAKISFIVLIRIKHTEIGSEKLRNWVADINSRLSGITGYSVFATTSNPEVLHFHILSISSVDKNKCKRRLGTFILAMTLTSSPALGMWIDSVQTAPYKANAKLLKNAVFWEVAPFSL
jgi:hypothetical protein